MKKLTLLSLLFIPLFVYAQPDLSDELVTEIKNRVKSEASMSIAIGIIDENGRRYYTYGTKTSGGEEVDENTVYEIGSISKVFTAIMLADAVEKGRIQLDDPVQNFLPEGVKISERNGEKVTMAHLSDHTSGIPRLPVNLVPSDPGNPYADYTVDNMYTYFNAYKLQRDIGSQYEYSNLAVGLLGHALALEAGKEYDDLMQEIIAKPLGMKSTSIALSEDQKARLALGHQYGQEVKNWDLPTLAGAGAIRSTVADMLNFLEANMGLKKSKLYSAMEMTHKSRHSKAGNGTEVGLGWHISPGEEGKVVWHNGGTGGYRTFSGFVKEINKGVVVLTNSVESADDIGMALLNSGAELRKVKTEVAEVADEILESYVGKYELAPGFFLNITKEGSSLFVQATGQQKFPMFAENENTFYLKVVQAKGVFNKENGKIISLTWHQGGNEVEGKKVE